MKINHTNTIFLQDSKAAELMCCIAVNNEKPSVLANTSKPRHLFAQIPKTFRKFAAKSFENNERWNKAPNHICTFPDCVILSLRSDSAKKLFSCSQENTVFKHLFEYTKISFEGKKKAH
jgi:hypothetical protein